MTEPRLLEAVRQRLGNQVRDLRLPPMPEHRSGLEDARSEEAQIGVPVATFPRWLCCTWCRKLASLGSGLFHLDSDEFRPDRVIPDDAAPWGLTFGHGIHACLGMELAGGMAPEFDASGAVDPKTHVYGAITTMASMLFAAGLERDPDRPAALDSSTVRTVFSAYPVVFTPVPESFRSNGQTSDQ